MHDYDFALDDYTWVFDENASFKLYGTVEYICIAGEETSVWYNEKKNA